MSAPPSRWRWLIGRLRSMSVPELGHRFREVIRRRTTRRWRQGWPRYECWAEGACPNLPGVRQRVQRAGAELRLQVAHHAAQFRAGHFAALGITWPAGCVDMAFPATVWVLDPATGRHWPGAEHYCFDIPYRLERGLGDVKFLWEFGRLQFLPVLAADYLLHGQADSLRAVERAIDSWHAANPPFRGLHWAEQLNVAIRAINLLVALSLCGDALPAATWRRARQMLAAHAQLLGLFPSLYSSANNHLVAECAGELMLSIAMPELPASTHAGALARRRLVEEANRQILADGWPAEQSPSYGAFTAECLLLAVVVARDAGAPFPATVHDRLMGFAHHVERLCNRRGQVGALGDNDEGRVFTLGRWEGDYPLSVAAAICAVFDRPLQAPMPKVCEWRQALFGHARSVDNGNLEGPWRFAQGGYSIDRRTLHGRECLLGYDHGPLGYLSIAAHGHADALATTLDIDGIGALVDPGTYLYHSGGEWRDWFRSTSAHNTLNLDGASQSRMSGPFNWSTKAQSCLESPADARAWPWQASHDGYLRAFGLRHRRAVQRDADGYVITDWLLGANGRRGAQVVFQAGLGCQAQASGDTVLVCHAGVPLLELHFEAPGQISVTRGGVLGQGGWVSPRFGAREPADRITWDGPVPANGAVVRLRILADDVRAT